MKQLCKITEIGTKFSQGRVRSQPGHAGAGRAVHSNIAVGRQAEKTQRHPGPFPAAGPRLLYRPDHRRDFGSRQAAAHALLQLVRLTTLKLKK